MKRIDQILANEETSIVPERFRNIALVQSIWPQIVGTNISNYTLPLKIQNKTLIIGISQSVWANEIQFHQAKILAELSQHGIQVEQMRTVTHRILRDAPPTTNHKNLSPATSPANNLAEGLSQVMIAQNELAQRRIEAGWKPCTRCQRLHPGPLQHCQDCLREKKERLNHKIVQQLTREPWTSNQQLRSICPQLPLEWFEKQRQRLYAHLHQKIYQGYWELLQEQPLPKEYRSLILQATMLICQKPPHHIQERHFKRSLKSLRFILKDYLANTVSPRKPKGTVT